MMKLSLILCALSLGVSLWAQAQQVPNSYRGYTAVNQVILQRVAQNNGFQLGQYLYETVQEPNVGDLLSLLGTYVGSGTDAEYRNGTPGPVSMLLWYIAFNKLSVDFAAFCDPAYVPKNPHPLLLQPQVQAALAPVCNWPTASAQSEAVLYNFWSALVGFDEPPSEFQAWKTYFLHEPSYQTARRSTVVSNMVLSALFNPYFLLKQ